jgi:hypothetical protein
VPRRRVERRRGWHMRGRAAARGGRGGAEPAEKKQRRKKRGMIPGTGLQNREILGAYR